MDSRDQLIAVKMTIPEIAKSIGVDSLAYLSVEGVKSIAAESGCDFCVGCFTGQYPVDPPKASGKNKFETKLSAKLSDQKTEQIGE